MNVSIDSRGFAVDDSGLSVWDLDYMSPNFFGCWQVLIAVFILAIIIYIAIKVNKI